MSLAYAVRQILVSPERTVLQELDCQRCGIGVRHNLIILAVNDQHRHFDGLQVLGKVGFRKSLDTPITSLDAPHHPLPPRSEEHTSELQSLIRISYAVFCLKKHT